MNYNDVKTLYKEINIEISEDEYNKLCKYQINLLEWNEIINLTAITDDKDVWIKHFIDSCTIAKYISESSKMIDIGTGAGFPSVPIKILRNDIELTLLDSLNKRIEFLKDVCSKLELKNVDFVHGRAEDVASDNKYREQFDVATARAVANLSTLSEYCLPFVKVNGLFICMKANNVQEEIENAKNAIKKLGGMIEAIEELELPEGKDKRIIILIRKISNTPKEYPRKAGTPSKKPIK